MTHPQFGSIEYSDEEFNLIQEALRKKLGPDFIATRPGPGGQKLQYVEGWRVVQLANEVFGFDSWGYSVTNMTVDFVDHNNGKFYVGVSATVRVTLKNGAYREDVGYGCVDGMRSKSQAMEKARKESITDGLKRALKSFGNLLGNCLNNKEYMKHVSRLPKTQGQASYAPDSVLTSNQLSSLPNYKKRPHPGPGRHLNNNPSSSGHLNNNPGPSVPHTITAVNKASTPLTHGNPVQRNLKHSIVAAAIYKPPTAQKSIQSGNVEQPVARNVENVLERHVNLSIINNISNINNSACKTTASSCESASTVDLTLSQLVGPTDDDFWEEAMSNIDDSFSQSITPNEKKTKAQSRVQTPLISLNTPSRMSPRLSTRNSAKRRKVDIPGLTN